MCVSLSFRLFEVCGQTEMNDKKVLKPPPSDQTRNLKFMKKCHFGDSEDNNLFHVGSMDQVLFGCCKI